MESILISINSKWVEKILNGEKTIEVRKTKPNCELPAKVYIYCTKNKSKKDELIYVKDPLNQVNPFYMLGNEYGHNVNLNGKVVAEFILNKVNEYKESDVLFYGCNYQIGATDFIKTALRVEEINNYGKGKPLYAWHIEDLIIYDKPKELSEFTVPNPDVASLGSLGGSVDRSKYPLRLPLEKAPQSWCYVEELEDERK